MVKRNLKRFLCILLVLALMCMSSFFVFYLTEVSPLYSQVLFKMIFLDDDSEDFKNSCSKLKSFYSKDVDYDMDVKLKEYSADISDLLHYASSCKSGVIVKATYLGRRAIQCGGEFKFRVNDVVMNSGDYPIEKGEKLTYTYTYFSSNKYYTLPELAYRISFIRN